MKYLAILIATLAMMFMACVQPVGTSSYPENSPYEGYPNEFAQPYTLFVGKWNHTCITHNSTDPLLTELAIKSLNDIWGSVSPIQDCGEGNDIELMTVANNYLPPNVLGQAWCNASGGYMIHCYIQIRENARFLGVMAHEIGHTLGLGHSQQGDQLMSPFCCNLLGSDDIAGIRFLYGDNNGNVPTPTVVYTPTSSGTTVPTIVPTTPTATPSTCVGLACVTRTPPATQTPTATPAPSMWILVVASSDEPVGTFLNRYPGGNTVYGFDSSTQKWHRYIKGLPSYVNDIVNVEEGTAYWVKVN